MNIYSKLMKSIIKENKGDKIKYVKPVFLSWSIVENPVNEDTRIKIDPSKEEWLSNLKNKFNILSEKINVGDDTKWGIIINENMKKIKLNKIMDNYDVDKENKTVTYKKNPKIVLTKDAIGKISQGVKALTTSQTKSISSTFKLSNYNEEDNTIEVNNEKINIDDLLGLERMLIYSFGSN